MTQLGQDRRRAYTVAAFIGTAAAFLFCGYELVRSPSNTLYKAAYGKEALPYVMAATPLAVIAVLYVYGRLLSWVGPKWTLILTTLASCALIAGSYATIAAGWLFGAAILYLTREAYIVLLMEQYWSYLNSTLGPYHARRLNGPICGIGSAGSIAGGLLVNRLAEPIGTAQLLLVAAAITLPTAILSWAAYRYGGEPRRSEAEPKSDSLGTRPLLRQPLLAILLIVILLTQAVSTFTDLSFQGILQDVIPDPDKQTAFSGKFYMQLNMVAAAMQFAITPVLLVLVPLMWVHRAIPLIHVATCLYLWQNPSLFSAGMAYMVFKAVDYSAFRAAKELLYVPLSFDSRYRAKELIDVFGYRLGKGGTSLLVIGAKMRFTIAEPALALAAAIAAGAWALCAIPLGRHARANSQMAREPVRS